MSSPPAELSESPNGLSISETEPISIPESEPSPPAADPDSKDEAAVEESTDDVQPTDAGDRNLEESKGDDHNAVEVQAVNAEAIDAVEEAAVEAVKAVEVEEEKQNGENSVKESDSEQIVEIPLKSIDVKGSKSFTMRELLDELKKDPSNPDETSDQQQDGTPLSEQSNQQYLEQNNAAMELITSVTGADEEGQSRQRILTFAARRYATALERNPDDYDALYNWALVLQESADNVSPDSSSPSKDALLEEACKKYEEATRLCPTLNDAYYNWAIAISDRAKMRGRTKEAEELWKQATKNYEKAVQLNWNSPQALNNWGLALQELSAIVPAREKQTIVKTAINKFRAAIQLQFDFHRAIYNLGTVLYGLAEDMSRTGGSNSKEVSHDELYSQSAIYIAAAHALKPTYSVYTSALKLVRSMLPLPYLKVGYLTAPPPGNPLAPHTDWKHSQFVLNHEGLHQINKAEQRYMSESLFLKTEDTGSFTRPAIRVEVPDILSVSACSDLTLPPGAGLCIGTIHGPVYLIAESWEYLDGWLDAIRLVYTIYARGKSEVLAGIIA